VTWQVGGRPLHSPEQQLRDKVQEAPFARHVHWGGLPGAHMSEQQLEFIVHPAPGTPQQRLPLQMPEQHSEAVVQPPPSMLQHIPFPHMLLPQHG